MGYELYLKKNEEKRIVAGHSWVYANEVARITGKDKNGSLATVFSHDGRFIGKGYINHASKILVRIFIRGSEDDGKQLYLNRIKAADDYRKKLGYDNCYRMVFAEADDLPALIVDRYGDVLVIQCLSLGIDMRKGMIVECLKELFSPSGIYERSDVAVRKKEGLPEVKGLLYGNIDDYVEIRENSIKMLVDVKNGQKRAISSIRKRTDLPCAGTARARMKCSTASVTAAVFRSTPRQSQSTLRRATFRNSRLKMSRITQLSTGLKILQRCAATYSRCCVISDSRKNSSTW